jgi:hypothetical protein
VHFAERSLGPEIDAAFPGVPGTQLHHGQAGRNEENEDSKYPQDEAGRPHLRRGRQPPDTQNGGYVQEHQVRDAQRPYQMAA